MRSLLWMSFECWHLDLDRLDDAALVLSELVGNAVRYGEGDEVRVSLHRVHEVLRLEVEDGSARPPVPRVAAEEDEGGRGLLIVDALSLRWGHEPRPDGKSVWVELPC